MACQILYSFRRCPYAMRARMALSASGEDYEHREVLLRDKPAEMLAASPKGTVPVFITVEPRVMDESLDIMLWALGRNDPKGWLNCERTEADRLIADNDGPFKHHLDRYKYKSRYIESAARGETDDTHRKAAQRYLQSYETRLQNAPYLLGERQSLADIAIFPFIRQFANTDIDWWQQSPYQALRSWLERHTGSELFLQIMKKRPPWSPNSSYGQAGPCGHIRT